MLAVEYHLILVDVVCVEIFFDCLLMLMGLELKGLVNCLINRHRLLWPHEIFLLFLLQVHRQLLHDHLTFI